MGSVAQRELTNCKGSLIPGLQAIIGKATPMFTTLHTTPLFRLHAPHGRPTGLFRSQQFYNLIRHLQSDSPPATPVHEEAAKATAKASYDRLIRTGFLAGRGFYSTPWNQAAAVAPGPKVQTAEGGLNMLHISIG